MALWFVLLFCCVFNRWYFWEPVVTPVLSWAPTGVLACEFEIMICWLPLLRLQLVLPEPAMMYCFDICRFIEFIERLLFFALPMAVVTAPPAPEPTALSVLSF